MKWLPFKINALCTFLPLAKNFDHNRNSPNCTKPPARKPKLRWKSWSDRERSCTLCCAMLQFATASSSPIPGRRSISWSRKSKKRSRPWTKRGKNWTEPTVFSRLPNLVSWARSASKLCHPLQRLRHGTRSPIYRTQLIIIRTKYCTKKSRNRTRFVS